MLRKKVILFLGTFALAASLCACGQDGASGGKTPTSNTGTAATAESGEKKNTIETSAGEVELGYTVRYYSSKPGGNSASGNNTYYANVPKGYSDLYPKGIYKYANSDKDHIIMFGRQYDSEDISFQVESAEDVIPTYILNIREFLDDINFYRTQDIFEITNSELVTINDLEMCRCEGYYAFVYQKDALEPEHQELKFVSYAAPLSNGAYAFWISFAPNMEEASVAVECVAKTFRETKELTIE